MDIHIPESIIEEIQIIDAVRGGRSDAYNSKQLQYNIDYAARLEAHVSDLLISQVRNSIRNLIKNG